MQQVIYADVLVFINAVVTFILLLTVKLFTDAETGAGRMLCASLVGGVYALVLLAPRMNTAVMLLTRGAMGVSIVFLAFRLRSARSMLRCTLLFVGASYLYAGALYALALVLDAERLTVRNGFGYYPVGVGTLLLATAALYFAIRLVKRRVFANRSADMLYDLELRLGERRVRTRALLDTGNTVRDLYFRRPVIVVTAAVAAGLADGIPADAAGLCEAEAGAVRYRLLPVANVGAGALLPAFTADRAEIRRENTHRVIESPCVAVTQDPLGGEYYGALLGERALNGDG